jgi:hypothetical protein
VWRTLKVITEDAEGLINQNWGQTPVRVNPDGAKENRVIEVVWSDCLCPVRSRITNIPTGATGFRYGDIVLHDGAPVGYRLNPSGQKRAVFNVLELFEPSRFSTYEVSIAVESALGLKELERACDLASVEIEDWTANIRNLCRACNEGKPHEGHDTDLKEPTSWSRRRRVGFAALELAALNGVLEAWAVKPGRRVVEVRCTLEAAVD